MVSGHLFDLYPLKDKMAIWIRQEDGTNVRLEDCWSHSIYVASDENSALKSVLENDEIMSFVKDYEFTMAYDRITVPTKSRVLKLTLADSGKAAALAGMIEASGRFGKFRLYNVDIHPAQAYLYENRIFPLARCEFDPGKKWECRDSAWFLDYKVPPFKTTRIDVNVSKGSSIPKFSDRIESISLTTTSAAATATTTTIVKEHSEASMLHELESEISSVDPDFVITNGGDSFAFPYLAYRAGIEGVDLNISRDKNRPLKKPNREGVSYFSYGKIFFKPTATKLFGRVHVDTSTSFLWRESELDGLFEIARTCRMPLHTAARASIGKCMSSLQLYSAVQKKILVPWKPVTSEVFKTYAELLIADRGGFVFQPDLGVHERVAEFDFTSLYPNIMLRKNISAETVKCACCGDSATRVPELGYNVCEKNIGIVPSSIAILLYKRKKYKKMKETADKKTKALYEARRSALKWILVTSFGYLGFNNAKFGRIDAHIAVCAYDRQIFLQAVRIAEGQDFRVLHGIVDSLWLQKKSADKSDYAKLKESIERQTSFGISFEGVYKWIAFLRSKASSGHVPVANRYFGAFEDGSLKVRGIEMRRHDTPPFFYNLQKDALELMAKGDNIKEVKSMMPYVQEIFNRYKCSLENGSVKLDELIFTKQTSKKVGEYQDRNTIENSALNQLDSEGKSLKAGQVVKYVITDYYGRKGKRVAPIELVDESTKYDVKRYTELLAGACNSITEPFEYQIRL